LGAIPHRVLLGTGQHRDRADQLGVGWQRPVRRHVGAQDTGQCHRIGVVGFLARDRMPLPVAGHGHRVDRIHRPVGSTQTRHQQPPCGLDRDRYRRVGAVAGLDQQSQQLIEPGCVVTDPPLGHQSAVAVDHGHVVVVL
jgi:hypothetical protein